MNYELSIVEKLNAVQEYPTSLVELRGTGKKSLLKQPHYVSRATRGKKDLLKELFDSVLDKAMKGK